MNKITPQELPPAVILIIDDDAVIQMQLRLYLQREGYKVIISKNGQEGVTAYVRHHPDLVLLDAIMPEMDGFECCQHLMSLSGAEYTPILMITGLDDQESVDQAFAVGATDFITKPIHWAVLRQRVRRLLYQVRLQQQLEAANRLLQRLATIDALTQINNRRRFDECLEQEWQRLTREGLPLSLILLDIDHFKLYNDNYGHPAGDSCLRQVAQGIQSALQRPADLVARYGGEEFAIILPNTDLAGAKTIAQRIQLIVKDLKISHPKSTVSEWISVSLGITCVVPTPNSIPEQLIQQADEALFEAKRLGRDQFFIYQTSSLVSCKS